MAESSGFFQAEWNETLMNPMTNEETGWWDRNYIAKQFCKYFSLFVGNGVFISPTNQLKVVAGQNNTVVVKSGWAFINGAFYYNDSDLILAFPVNNTVTPRTDTIRVRYSEETRDIKSYVITDDTELVRGENVYDLIIAEIYVAAGAVTVIDANITDTRPDETKCGFVKGLLSVVETNDLFLQFQSMFDEWFDTVKDQVTGDLAIQLQLEFEQINNEFIQYKAEYEQAFEDYKAEYEGLRDDITAIANSAVNTINTFVAKYFTIPEEGTTLLTFVNKQCIINDERITAGTLIDVYFDDDTIQEAEDCQIYVNSYDGQIVISGTKQPAFPLVATIGVRIR